MIDWHRLFGLALLDLFEGTPYEVELEKDLSVKQQFLDIVILKKTSGTLTGRLPDGLDNLADHNLVTYKSMREPLDDWALKELTGHYVNYRKQTSGDRLVQEGRFRLYGIATRFPNKLAGQVSLEALDQGVYEVCRGTDQIRIIVLSEINRSDHNALWHLFSGVEEQVAWGAVHYHKHTGDMSTVINQLFENYRLEGINVSYTIEDFRRDFTRDHIQLLSADERLQGLPVEERLRGLPVEERLRGLPVEERLHGLPVEDRLRSLSVEEIKEYLAKLESDRQGNRKN
jgi:hypothetical protein